VKLISVRVLLPTKEARLILTDKRISVLQVSDGDQVRVDDKVRNNVKGQNLPETPLRSPESENGEGDGETDIGHDDLGPMVRLEDGGRRLEV
jgi:hypothetical protein